MVVLLLLVSYRCTTKFTHIIVSFVVGSSSQVLKLLGNEYDDEYLQFDVCFDAFMQI